MKTEKGKRRKQKNLTKTLKVLQKTTILLLFVFAASVPFAPSHSSYGEIWRGKKRLSLTHHLTKNGFEYSVTPEKALMYVGCFVP